MWKMFCYSSVYKWDSVMEIYGDAQAYGLKSANSKAVHNSSIAISWLEATFPELAEVAERANLATVKAHPHALFDASLSLQVKLFFWLLLLNTCKIWSVNESWITAYHLNFSSI